GHDGVLIRHHDAELAERAVSPVAVISTSPELIAVALIPIALGIAAVGDLLGSRHLNPVARHQLLAVPLAALQVQLSELGNVFRPTPQTVPAERDPLRARSPSGIFNSQRLEKSWPKVIEHGLTGHRLNDGGLHVSGRGVVEKVRAGF